MSTVDLGNCLIWLAVTGLVLAADITIRASWERRDFRGSVVVKLTAHLKKWSEQFSQWLNGPH